MKRLGVAAAAFAAGMMTFAVSSHAESDRAAQRSAAVSVEKPADKKSAKAEKPAGKDMKTVEAAEAGRKKPVKTATAAKDKQVKTAKAGKRKGKTKIDLAGVSARAAQAKAERLAVANGKRPELKAVARKAVRGDRKKNGDVAVAAAAVSVKDSGSYTTLVTHYASTYGVPYSLAHAVISVESRYRANARGSAGEIGLMQIKPATARMMGYSGGARGLFDPETNIKFGMKYLGMAHQLAGGSTCGTILRYNAGHGARRMNPISAAYCSKVKGML